MSAIVDWIEFFCAVMNKILILLLLFFSLSIIRVDNSLLDS